ncbi:MAG: hypothetical protein MPK06_04295 [Alphaproteobacteria bacterium]|nr:hypothetical protein [Alphaproteobacteria bacterium]MDA8005742.1 hypothetical protein [Alphaproteobacteria bacterium]MDA8013109.1 hypothetical protein [Alphaproteobacteria bacterium]
MSKKTTKKASAKSAGKRTTKTAPKKSAGNSTKRTTKTAPEKSAGKATGKARAGGARLSADELRSAAIAAAFEICAEHGWASVDLEAVARRVGVSPMRLRSLYARAHEILEDCARRIDASLAAETLDADLSPREALLELLMLRLDALESHRAGVVRYWDDLRTDPRPGLRLAPCLYTSMEATLTLAGVRGVRSRDVAGLGVVYLAALRVWVSDEDSQRARTLAALDRYLLWAERAAHFCGRHEEGE